MATDGFFAEYAVVDYRNTIILPQAIKMETASPLFCGGIAGELRHGVFWPIAL